MSDLQSIYRYIEENRENHIQKLCEYLQQPSVSATGEGITDCAKLLASYYRALGCQEVEIVGTSKWPAIWAYYDAGAPVTLAVYGMYDVQPVADQEWLCHPFSAKLIPQEPFSQVVIARGAYNSKGPYRLFLNALESIIAIHGTLPVNLMFFSEGEEEVGSTNFPDFVHRYSDRLKKAHALLDIEANQNQEGQVVIKLGNKGIVYLELVASGEKWGRGPQSQPTHSSRKAVVNNPALRLIQAIEKLISADEKTILIDGIYDDVMPPTSVDEMLLEELEKAFDHRTYAKDWDVPIWLDDLNGRDWLNQYLFSPSLNINGIHSGHTGDGTLTIVPHVARAKIDIRLVPVMQPQKVIALLRTYLDKLGFSDIEIDTQVAYGWNKTSPKENAVQTMLNVYRQHNIDYEVWPFSAGSEPLYIFTQDPYNLPMLRVGVGHGSKNHIANEYLVVEGNGRVAGLVESEKIYVDLLFALAENCQI